MTEPMLLAAAKRALVFLERDRDTLLECNCRLDGDLKPIRDTIDPGAAFELGEVEAAIDHLRAAIEEAGHGPAILPITIGGAAS